MSRSIRVLGDDDLAGIRHAFARGVGDRAVAQVYGVSVTRIRQLRQTLAAPAAAPTAEPAPPAPRGPYQKAVARRDRLLAAVTEAAERNAPCPSNAALAEMLGTRNLTMVTRLLGDLERAQLCHVRFEGRDRCVDIRATGRSTAPAARRSRKVLLNPGQLRVLDLLSAAASAGAPCPSDRELATAGGYTHPQSISLVLARLAAAGEIIIVGRGRDRVIEVIGIGRRTAAPARPLPVSAERAALRAEVKRLFDAGKGQAEIARTVGQTVGQVAGMLTRLGVARRPSRRQRPPDLSIAHPVMAAGVASARDGALIVTAEEAERRRALRREMSKHEARRRDGQLGDAVRDTLAGLTPQASPVVMPPLSPAGAVPGRVGARRCAYPIGDPKAPGFHFCDAPLDPTRPGTSYCADHHALCWTPAPKRSACQQGALADWLGGGIKPGALAISPAASGRTR